MKCISCRCHHASFAKLGLETSANVSFGIMSYCEIWLSNWFLTAIISAHYLNGLVTRTTCLGLDEHRGLGSDTSTNNTFHFETKY